MYTRGGAGGRQRSALAVRRSKRRRSRQVKGWGKVGWVGGETWAGRQKRARGVVVMGRKEWEATTGKHESGVVRQCVL